MGGNLDKYRGDSSVEPAVKPLETAEQDKIEFRCKYKESRARDRLDTLTTHLMYRPQDVNNYTEKSIKGGFKQLGYDDKIQSMMWDEYKKFVLKYVLK